MEWTTFGIIGLLLSFITTLGVWLGPRLVENSRRRYQAKREHLETIKQNVIMPLLNQIEYYFMPIINGKLSNVVEKTEFKPIQDAPIDQFGGINQIELSVFTVRDFLDKWEEEDWQRDTLDRPVFQRVGLQLDELLYDDLKNCHEPGLVGQWEAFVSKIEEYNRECFSYVESIRDTLREESELSVWTSYEGKHGLNAAGLAAYIWGRQLGLRSEQIKATDRSNQFDLVCGNQIMAMGPETGIRSCFETVSRLVLDREKVSVLIKMIEDMGLEKDAYLIRDKLLDYLQTINLRRKCVYS